MSSSTPTKTHIHCLGDSHLDMLYYLGTTKQPGLTHTQFHVHLVGGATAIGLKNPHSHTQALNKFRRTLLQIPTSGSPTSGRPTSGSPTSGKPQDKHKHYLLFLLGEVDCGFVIWWRAQNHQDSVESQLQLSFSTYTNFVLECYRQGYSNIILCSVPLPTIQDGQTAGFVVKARKGITATQLQRTQLTQRYNAMLRQFCREHSFLFLDYEADILDPSSGLVQPRFRHPNPGNHHLCKEAMREVLLRRLQELGFR